VLKIIIYVLILAILIIGIGLLMMKPNQTCGVYMTKIIQNSTNSTLEFEPKFEVKCS
jgi:cytochrome b561